jgi:23S rRNA A2030 N6-methylase RlmJ
MAGTTVTREQFQILKDHVVHIPTGARFNAYPGRPEISTENLGRAGDRLENGDDYRPEDIRVVAAQLLRERKQA